jgi:hypothetical protein
VADAQWHQLLACKLDSAQRFGIADVVIEGRKGKEAAGVVLVILEQEEE